LLTSQIRVKLMTRNSKGSRHLVTSKSTVADSFVTSFFKSILQPFYITPWITFHRNGENPVKRMLTNTIPFRFTTICQRAMPPLAQWLELSKYRYCSLGAIDSNGSAHIIQAGVIRLSSLLYPTFVSIQHLAWRSQTSLTRNHYSPNRTWHVLMRCFSQTTCRHRYISYCSQIQGRYHDGCW